MLKRGGFLIALALLTAVMLPARAADPCLPVEAAFNALLDRYIEAGKEAITRDGHEEAIERARKRAIAGDRNATLAIVGVPLLMRSRSDLFQLSTLRQVCGFSERNRLALHIAACAYFNAVNPLGNAEEKRAAVEREITRFGELPAAERQDELAEAMRVLEACIAVTPIRPSL